MTIICYRDGIMAADSTTYTGNIRVATRRKIVRRRDGALAAASGLTGTCARFEEWFLGGCGYNFDPKSSEDDFLAVMVLPGDIIQRLSHLGEVYRCFAPWVAIGCPQDFALGALAAGANAEDAVRLCIQFHDGCGGDVQVERI